jgi:hypothetical protein
MAAHRAAVIGTPFLLVFKTAICVPRWRRGTAAGILALARDPYERATTIWAVAFAQNGPPDVLSLTAAIARLAQGRSAAAPSLADRGDLGILTPLPHLHPWRRTAQRGPSPSPIVCACGN